jgi:hypothetical protein
LDYFRGAKAGLVAGLSWAVITALLGVASTPSDLVALVVFPVIRVIYGLIFGIVFAAVADRFLVSRSYLFRGFVFGLVLGIVEVVLNLIALAGGGTGVVVNLIVGIGSSLVFGSVLGYSYGRFVGIKSQFS